MAGRIRTIKPELLEDERTACLSHRAHRLFIGVLLVADDYGNFRASPTYLAGAIFWGVGAGLEDARDALAELIDVGLVAPYSVRGQVYGAVRGWSKHQRVDKPGKARLPSCSDPEAVSVQLVRNVAGDSRIIPELVANDSRLTSDLRPPTSDLDHRPSTAERAPASQSRPSGLLVANASSQIPLALTSAPTVPDGDGGPLSESGKAQKKFRENPHGAFVDGWEALFKARTGQSYGWAEKKAHGQVETILKLARQGGAEPAAEALRRAITLFETPPSLVARDGTPPDLGTLLTNWNKLATPPTGRGGGGFARAANQGEFGPQGEQNAREAIK